MEYGIKIKPNSFRIVRETLERIGYRNWHEFYLQPECYILYKKGEYYLVHWKEMHLIDGVYMELTEDDLIRRNNTLVLLHEWNMLKDEQKVTYNKKAHIDFIKHSDKEKYDIRHRYNIGKIKKTWVCGIFEFVDAPEEFKETFNYAEYFKRHEKLCNGIVQEQPLLRGFDDYAIEYHIHWLEDQTKYNFKYIGQNLDYIRLILEVK
ncbi:translational repressor RegA [uncultured Arcobacter sp.]|uniref:translational repressor RegA n=1 Tax=uncultured Arcobacter sp. TaxID=165434 RepID=UPI0026220708|nr:translational repressor RegA [uncultured Arcobacter sp.]